MARMAGAGTAATRPGSTVLGQALLYHHSAPVRAGPLRPGQLGVLVTIQRSTLSNRGSPGACQLFASISPAPKKAPGRGQPQQPVWLTAADASGTSVALHRPRLDSTALPASSSSPLTIAPCCRGDRMEKVVTARPWR